MSFLRLRRGALAVAVSVSALLLVATTAVPAAAAAAPDFQMPFACGQTWLGSTRPYHSPSPYAIDWTRNSDDLGHPVIASVPGTVTSVINLGDRSYGLYVVVDHGGGWTTLYAHLKAAFVVTGEYVDQGQAIGLLGDSGDATGPHLHFEERLNKVDQPAYFNSSKFVYNSWLTSANCADAPVTGDWNGDGTTDVGVFYRKGGLAQFQERYPDGTVQTIPLGYPTDQPITGDWDGDGQTEVGVWHPATHTFRLRSADGTITRISFGSSQDEPVTGDWDGDGRTDVGLWDPTTATFYLRDSDGAISSVVWGVTGDIPVTGDWDGDGRWQVGVYDPTTSTFLTRRADGSQRTIKFGVTGDLPVVGYFNLGLTSDVGVWDPATAVFTERVTAKQQLAIPFGTPR